MDWAAAEKARIARTIRSQHRADILKRLGNANWYTQQTADAPNSPSHKEWTRLAAELQAELAAHPEL